MALAKIAKNAKIGIFGYSEFFLAILAILAREILFQAVINLMRVISDGAPKRCGGPQ